MSDRPPAEGQISAAVAGSYVAGVAVVGMRLLAVDAAGGRLDGFAGAAYAEGAAADLGADTGFVDVGAVARAAGLFASGAGVALAWDPAVFDLVLVVAWPAAAQTGTRDRPRNHARSRCQ